MRVRSALLAAAVLPVALFTVAADVPENCTVVDAGADGAADDVIACEASAYLDCSAAAGGKVYTPLDSIPTSAAKPTASFTSGAGCGKQETAQATGTATTSIYDINTTGFLEGNLDTLSVELHSIYAGSLRAGGNVTLDVRVVVGGQSPVGFTESPSPTGGTIASPKRFLLDVPLVPSSTRVSESMTFTITDLYEMFPQLSKAGDGAGTFQTFDVTVGVVESDWGGAFVFGASEIPANVTINGGERGLVVSARDLVAR